MQVLPSSVVPVYTFFTAESCKHLPLLKIAFANLTCCSTDNCNVPDMPVLVRVTPVVAAPNPMAVSLQATSTSSDQFWKMLDADKEPSSSTRGLLQLADSNTTSLPLKDQVTRCYVEGARNGTLISADYTYFVTFMEQRISCLKYQHQCRGEPAFAIVRCSEAEVRRHSHLAPGCIPPVASQCGIAVPGTR
jgi:hypothetical protein